MSEFFENAITAGCRRSLSHLAEQEFIQSFYLAGGTALALQIGHRLSTDLDWFVVDNPLRVDGREDIQRILRPSGAFEIVSERDGQIFAKLFGVDVSFIHQPHPLLESPIDYLSVTLASPVDIGLMKLAAVNSRGTRRDFVDLYCLRDMVSLDKLLELAPRKYHDRPSFLAVTARALTYFADAEQQPMPVLFHAVDWNDVKKYCQDAARNLIRCLSGLDAR